MTCDCETCVRFLLDVRKPVDALRARRAACARKLATIEQERAQCGRFASQQSRRLSEQLRRTFYTLTARELQLIDG